MTWPYIDLKALRMALSNAGIAAPESDEMLAAKLSENLTDLFSAINSRPKGKLNLNAAPIAPALTVIIPDEWEPCSPEYLQKHPGACYTAPRVWSEEHHNHYHPKNWPTAQAVVVPEEKPTDISYAYFPITKAKNEGWNACRSVMLAQQPVSAGLEILSPILTELDRAMRKFPTWPTDPIHASKILDEEVGELSKAVLQATYEPHKSGPDEVRDEAIQAAAMAIRFIASLDCYQYTPSAQHEQQTLANGDKGMSHD
jgi:hypothetical protein